MPFSAVPPFPFALLEEGHFGVALFMTLSGYLFAKIVGTKTLNYPNFLWSRAVRLGPLLIVCLGAWYAISAFDGHVIAFRSLARGIIYPTLPGGAWSLTVEAHFYLIFPILLWLSRRFGTSILVVGIFVSTLLRAAIWLKIGSVQYPAYWTIIGSIDQFLAGMFFAATPLSRKTRAALAASLGLVFIVFWQFFDAVGGFFNNFGYPSPTPLWIIIPTIQAVTFGAFISWYDNAAIKIPHSIDFALSKIGEWSFSIYLLHFFLREVFIRASAGRIGSPDYFWFALSFATVCFFLFLPIPAASYHFFEKPILRFRKPYLAKTILREPKTV